MKHVKLSSLACAFATVLTTLLLTTSVVRAAPVACGSWSVAASPNVGSKSNYLLAVASVSTNHVWAVGNYYAASGIAQTLVEHWDGASWSAVPSPNVGTASNFLSGVSALSATDVWAVGEYFTTGGVSQALIEHWDGTRWSVANPDVQPHNVLYSVVAISANNVWAVGRHITSSSLSLTLVLHWNGLSWSVVASPSVGSNNVLSSVAAVSSTDIWAVGTYVGSVGETLVLHWNGTSWNVVKSPNVGSSGSHLSGVAAVSSTNVWAVGNYVTASKTGQTLIEQWNGTSWNVVKSPNVGSSGNYLSGVAAVSSTNVWAVGDYAKTLIEQWNGTSWNVVKSPNVGSSGNYLSGVATLSGSSNAWAVGGYAKATNEQTLSEFTC